MAMTGNFEQATTPSPEEHDRHGGERDKRRWRWLDRLVGTPHRSSIRQVYVVNNQDWLAPKSNLTDQQAYDAIVDLYNTVDDAQYQAAMDDLKNARPPQGEGSETSTPHP